MQQTTCKLKMAKCSWNVIKLDNSHNVWGVEMDMISSCDSVWFMLLNIYGIEIKWLYWIFN